MLVTPCDNWEGPVNGSGYGTVYVAKTAYNRSGSIGAHRLVWMQNHGSIPTGFVVMHTCDNRRCINIDHLVMGSQSENLRDAGAKGAWARSSHCRNGHEWVASNIYQHPSGQLHCLECRRASDRKRQKRVVA